VGDVKPRFTYEEIYKNLDGITAVATSMATTLYKQKGEMDSAYVKRIVATYLELAQGG
jgi:hypothetical protein